MPSIQNDNNDSDGEEMDQDSAESDKSTHEESGTSSGSEDDDSSELDEEDCERRRSECLDDMADLERQFMDLKEQLYRERVTQVETKLEEVKSGHASEYLQPLAQLQDNMRLRTQVSGILRELKVANINNKYEAEEQATNQNFKSDKIILFDTVKSELEEKIRRLEEDRNNIDITSDLWNEQSSVKCKRKADSMTPEKRKKPVTVSGPYIVYMLSELDILEDWTAIKKALKASKRKSEHVFRTEKTPYIARFEEGKLYYEGQWYRKGQQILIENKLESPLPATITSVNTGEVCVRQQGGVKSKLYIGHLQRGKYVIRHSHNT